MSDCGGCESLGAHRRHCPRNPDYDFRLVLADRAEDLGDQIGSNNISAANYAYSIAGLLRMQVRDAREAIAQQAPSPQPTNMTRND